MWLTRRGLPTVLEDGYDYAVPGSQLLYCVKMAAFRLYAAPRVTSLQTDFGSSLDAAAKADGFISHCTGRYCLFSMTMRLRMTGASYRTEALAVNFPKYIGNT